MAPLIGRHQLCSGPRTKPRQKFPPVRFDFSKPRQNRPGYCLYIYYKTRTTLNRVWSSRDAQSCDRPRRSGSRGPTSGQLGGKQPDVIHYLGEVPCVRSGSQPCDGRNVTRRRVSFALAFTESGFVPFRAKISLPTSTGVRENLFRRRFRR